MTNGSAMDWQAIREQFLAMMSESEGIADGFYRRLAESPVGLGAAPSDETDRVRHLLSVIRLIEQNASWIDVSRQLSTLEAASLWKGSADVSWRAMLDVVGREMLGRTEDVGGRAAA